MTTPVDYVHPSVLLLESHSTEIILKISLFLLGGSLSIILIIPVFKYKENEVEKSYLP